MAIVQNYKMTITNDAAVEKASATYTASGDAEETFSVVSPQSSDVTVPFTLDISTCIGWWVVSDQDVTMEENAVPDFTTGLLANVPFVWYKDAGTGFTATNPMGAVNIVTLKFVNGGSVNANVKGGFLTT